MKFYEHPTDSSQYRGLKERQLSLWQTILGNVEVGKRFKNPTRNDNEAGAVLKEKNGIIRLFDPPSKWHGKNFFQVFMQENNCTIEEAYNRIYIEVLKQNIPPDVITNTVKKRPKARYTTRKWNLEDRDFWYTNTKITSTMLRAEQCFPGQRFFTTDYKGFYHERFIKGPFYINIINGRLKAYGPKNRFFWSNMKGTDIGGNSPFFGDVLFVTKNLKSYLCLVQQGFCARYVTHETVGISKEQFQIWNENFKHIVFFMDNDVTGVKYANNLVVSWNEIIGNNCSLFVYPKGDFYKDQWGNIKPVSDPYDICYVGINLKNLLKDFR